MAKLRKMLGDVNSPAVRSLMELIETQSLTTLSDWAIGEVEAHVKEIYQREYPDDTRITGVLAAARDYLAGLVKLADVKAMIKEINQIAGDLDAAPQAQAAARAVAAACSTVYLPTGALGYTFYFVAAIVYDRAGLGAKREVYDAMAAEEFEKLLDSLKAAALPDEKNPVKVKWNC